MWSLQTEETDSQTRRGDLWLPVGVGRVGEERAGSLGLAGINNCIQDG